MKVYEMIEWLESLDPELVVYIEGYEQSSNLHPSTNRFEFYHESRKFSPNLSDINGKALCIGLEV